MKRCSGPCCGKITKEDYAKLVKEADGFLSGRSTAIQTALAEQMQAASDAMEFEKAASLRDRIAALTHVQSAQGINPRGVNEADVIALHMENGQACVQVFFIRANQNWGNQDFYPRVDTDNSPADTNAQTYVRTRFFVVWSLPTTRPRFLERGLIQRFEFGDTDIQFRQKLFGRLPKSRQFIVSQNPLRR